MIFSFAIGKGYRHPRSRAVTGPFTVLLFFLVLLFPQLSQASEGTSPPPEICVNQDVVRGIELLYNADFDEAERIFGKLVSERPKIPMGYFYMAMVSWSKLSIGFWTPEFLKQYVERIDLAIAVARKRIENQEADSFDYFYLGGALGFKGRFELMKHNWLSSYNLAYEAVNALRKCLKMDPGNVDVLLGLGIYDYYTARLSGVARFLANLFFHKGNREEGLRKLQTAADHATYSAIEAKSMLLHIYLFMEEDFFKALPLTIELGARFKKNPRYEFFEGIVYVRKGQDSDYSEVLNSLRTRSRKMTSQANALIWSNQALYLEASYHLFKNQPAQARTRLDAILDQVDPKTDPAMAAWPILKKGMSYDLEGNRRKAMELYRYVLDMENGAGAQFLAERYIREIPRQGDPFLGY